jgi:hypothetical protein
MNAAINPRQRMARCRVYNLGWCWSYTVFITRPHEYIAYGKVETEEEAIRKAQEELSNFLTVENLQCT